MFPSTLRRLAALAAVAAVGLVAPVPAAQAHPGHHRQHIATHLTIAKQGLDANGVGAISGRLTARQVPLADRAVYLLSQRDDRTWVRVRSEQTDRRGAVTFRVSPEVRTKYRLIFLGGGRFDPSSSRVVVLAPQTTAVTASASPTQVDPGGAATVSALVTQSGVPVPNAAVELLARPQGAHGYAVSATGATAGDGSVAFAVTPSRTTRYVVRLVETAALQGARSNVVVIAVRAATRLSIRKDAFGDVFAVAGLLTSGGDGLQGRTVTLQQQAAGATTWVDVAHKKTKRDGWVGFRRDRVPGTSYRLSFAGSPRLAPAISLTVVA